MENLERQEIWCHECSRYVQFDIDLSLDGNHVLKCPNCGHEHCRVVKNGIITGERWDSRNGFTYNITSATFSTTSSWSTTYSTSTASSSAYDQYYLWQAWARVGT